MILKVASTSKFLRWVDVITSTWIYFSNSMKSGRTFLVEFLRQTHGESTKICPLGIHCCKKRPLALDCRQKFSVNIKYTYSFNFNRGFHSSFSMLFPLLELFLWAQKECLRFLKSYLKLEILIFFFFAVTFLVDMFY